MTTPQEYFDLLAATCDEAWLQPKLDDPDSLALLTALVDMAVRIDHAQLVDGSQLLISEASGGTPGNTFVTLSSAAGPGGTLAAGSVLFEDARGWQYFLTANVLVPAGSTTVVIHVASFRLNNLVNTVDDPDMSFLGLRQIADASNTASIILTVTADHTFTVGDIIKVNGITGNTAANGIRRVRSIPAANQIEIETTAGGAIAGSGAYAGGGTVQPAPLELEVVSAEPVTGGFADYLSMHGRERGQFRQEGETVGDFRARVRNITDVVSPCALSDAIVGVANSQGIQDVTIREPFELGETPTLKAAKSLGSFRSAYLDSDFLDDPDARMFSLREVTQFFQIDLGIPASLVQYGAFFDAGLTSFADGIAFFDSADLTSQATAFLTVSQEADAKRAEGVQFDLVYTAIQVVQGAGTQAAVGLASTFLLAPPAGKLWQVVEFMVGLSAPDPSTGGTYRQQLTFTFEDASTFTTPLQTLYDSAGVDNYPLWRLLDLGYPLGKRITQVEGFAGADGTSTVELVLNMWVNESIL